jgi:GAF domain-containing protein
MTMKKAKKGKDLHGHFQDILETVSLLDSSTVPEKVIEMVLNDLRERLGKRARCAFLEGDDLKLRFWAGEHVCPIEGLQINKDSVVWDALKKGVAVNLTDPHQTNGYKHTLSSPIKVKAIIPLRYADPITQKENKLGALIVDSGTGETPISAEDFQYLQIIGQLISAIIGRAKLIEQLMTFCSRQESILMETTHNFRNRIVVIGGFSRQIAQMAHGTELAEKAIILQKEVKALEFHLAIFEKYMSMKV